MEGIQHRRLSRKPTSNGSRATAAEDVFFGGRTGSKWSNPPNPNDYAEIFGGLAASCSIPVLNLPPVSDDAFAAASRNSTLDYMDIFGGFRSGDFGASYEELFPVKTERTKPHSSNKERYSKEKGTNLQPSLYSGSAMKNQNQSNAASIKMDQYPNHKVSQRPNICSTKLESQPAKQQPSNGSTNFDKSVSVSVSDVTFSIDPYQISSSKNNYSSVPESHNNGNEFDTVADGNLKDTTTKPHTCSLNRINEAREEVKCSEKPSFAEMAAEDDNPSNEQYHSCSSSDQSTIEGEDFTSDQSHTIESRDCGIADGVTEESHLVKTESSSPSCCATSSQNSFKPDQLNTTGTFEVPQTATSTEGLHSKVTNKQFQSSGEGKHSLCDQSANNCSQSPVMNSTSKEDIETTLFSDTAVSEFELEVGQKQFQNIDSIFCDRDANGRHLSHSCTSVSGPGERKYDPENKFLTVLDINLRTVPCKVPPPARPPPSRPPPKPASIQGHTVAAVQMKNVVSGASETDILIETSKGDQLDVEDASSAAAASNAMKEAVEQAVVKIKIAKESMERKKDNLQCRKKLGKSHSIQDKEREADAPPQIAQLSEGQQSTDNHYCKYDASVSDGKINIPSDIVFSESESTEEMKQNTHDKATDVNMIFSRLDENLGTWKIEEQFVELVNSDKSFSKVEDISDSSISTRPKMPVTVVDEKLKESETHSQVQDENNAKAHRDAPTIRSSNLLDVSESYVMEKANDSQEEYQVTAQVKNAEESCSTSYSGSLASGIEDTIKEELSSCQDTENEVPQKGPGVHHSELEIPMTNEDPDLCYANEDKNESSRNNDYEEMASRVDADEEPVCQMPQFDVRDYGTTSSETNHKVESKDMNLKDPEPFEVPEISSFKELEVPSTSRVRKKWNIPKFSVSSILATEEACDQREKGQISEAEMVTEEDSSKVLNENLEACENGIEDADNREVGEHEFAAVEHAYQENSTVNKVDWQYFNEKITTDTQDEAGHSSQKQAEIEVDSEFIVVEEQLDGEGCNQTRMESESASSFQDDNIRLDVADAYQNAEKEKSKYDIKRHSFKHPGNAISSDESMDVQNLEEMVKKLPEIYKTGQMQEERVLREDELKIDTERLEEERRREQERKSDEEREKERERKLEEERERERESEKERGRKLEEEREREREREKGRQAVERAIRESRERAERAAVDRVTAEEEREKERERKLEEEREREREREKERGRKLEEEREREREREKDRQAVERAIRESRERAERAAVDRATAEARQRALAEAREKAEKTSADGLLQAGKASREARLRAERAAVERATAEARERAAERARAEKAAQEAKDRSNSTSRDWNIREGGAEGITKVASKDEPAVKRSISSSDFHESSRGTLRYSYSANSVSYVTDKVGGNEDESTIRCKARLERHQRTVERAAKALAEKNMRDLQAQKEQAERNRLAEILDAEVRRWSSGKEGNLRALLSTLQYILGPESGWQPIPLTEVITAAAVKKAYRKATLCVHPDKLQQRRASIQQKYICEKIFDLLKEAWNRFNSEER